MASYTPHFCHCPVLRIKAHAVTMSNPFIPNKATYQPLL